MTGATTMKMRVLYQPSGMMTENMVAGAGVNGGMHHGGAGVATDQSVGGGGGKSPPPGEEIPDDGAEESGHDHVLIDVIEADHATADSLGDGGAEEEGSEKVEGRGPQDGELGRQARGSRQPWRCCWRSREIR